MKPSLRAAVVAVATGTILGVSVPANATLEFKDRWTDNGTESFSDCGIDQIDVVRTAHGTFSARQIKSSGGQAWLGHNNYFSFEVFTNPDNGRSFAIRSKGNFREVRGTQVEGDIWRFEWKDSGATFALYDGDGNLVWRDRGTVSGVDVFDTLGDGQVGGEYISSDITAYEREVQGARLVR